MMKSLGIFLIICLIGACTSFGQFHMRFYRDRHIGDSSSEEDNTVLRSYRRCMWEQSKFLPRRLVLLSICSNLFCENNQSVSRSRSIFVLEKKPRPNDCLDILPDQCEQGDEEELMYKPFPDCCPVYCNLKRRMKRLRTMHIRHRMLLNTQQSQAAAAAASGGGGGSLLSEYGLNNMNFK